jgi:hypothetical protein
MVSRRLISGLTSAATVFLAGAVALGSNVVIVNPTSAPITNRVTQLVTSADTLAYQGATNAFINPVLPATGSVNEWKVSNGVVMVLSQADSNAITIYNSNLVFQVTTNRQYQAKAAATNTVEDLNEMGRLIRALAEVTMDEINILRASPTNVFTPRTLSQLKAAIQTKLQAQPDFAP